MKDNEHKIQSEFISIFRLKYPAYRYILFAIPNGGHRNIIVAAKLKKEGVLAGTPDVFFAKGNEAGKHGLFIEFKYGKNKPNENQLNVHENLTKFAYVVKIAYSCNEALQHIENYLNEKI